MEAVNAGVWAFIPALTAIVTVFILRDVIASLFIGVLTGVVIYTVTAGTGLKEFLTLLFETIFNSTTQNIPLITFMLMLGALVSVITMSGGHLAYGRWVTKKVKSARGISVATIILGIFIFIDDYFSCLLTGAVMGPMTDKYKISREKLAYFIDSTAAPVCIMAPISSWTMTITQIVEDSGMEGGLLIFVGSIPYNFYAIFALIFVFYIAITRRDFLYMRKCEERGPAPDGKDNPGLYGTENDIKITSSGKGSIFDLVLPNVAVIILSLLSIAWLGGFFGPGKTTLVEAYVGADTTLAINFGCLGALFLCFLLYIPRKLLSIRDFFEGSIEGMKSMFTAVFILIMAWSLSAITTGYLGAAAHVELAMGSMKDSLNIGFIPAAIFILSAAASFGLGSWGTFLVTIPFIAIIAQVISPQSFGLFLAATLAGSVFGDHASPITDTTILASIGARSNHLGHVKSQLPYALLVCFGSAAAFLVTGFFGNLAASYAAGSVFIIAVLLVIYRMEKKRHGRS